MSFTYNKDPRHFFIQHDFHLTANLSYAKVFLQSDTLRGGYKRPPTSRLHILCTGADMLIKHEAIKPIEFDKLEIIDYTAGQDTSSSFAEITVPVGVRHKFSWSNRSDKYYYVVRGSVSFTVDEESDNLSSGDVCIIPKGVRFSYANAGSGDAKLILIHTPSFKLECEVFEE